MINYTFTLVFVDVKIRIFVSKDIRSYYIENIYILLIKQKLIIVFNRKNLMSKFYRLLQHEYNFNTSLIYLFVEKNSEEKRQK